MGDAGCSRPCFEVAGHEEWREPSRLAVRPVQELLAALEDDRDKGFVFGVRRLDTAMREICIKLGIATRSHRTICDARMAP